MNTARDDFQKGLMAAAIALYEGGDVQVSDFVGFTVNDLTQVMEDYPSAFIEGSVRVPLREFDRAAIQRAEEEEALILHSSVQRLQPQFDAITEDRTMTAIFGSAVFGMGSSEKEEEQDSDEEEGGHAKDAAQFQKLREREEALLGELSSIYDMVWNAYGNEEDTVARGGGEAEDATTSNEGGGGKSIEERLMSKYNSLKGLAAVHDLDFGEEEVASGRTDYALMIESVANLCDGKRCYCLHQIAVPFRTPCHHLFHEDCVELLLDSGSNDCPQCRKPLFDDETLRRTASRRVRIELERCEGLPLLDLRPLEVYSFWGGWEHKFVRKKVLYKYTDRKKKKTNNTMARIVVVFDDEGEELKSFLGMWRGSRRVGVRVLKT